MHDSSYEKFLIMCMLQVVTLYNATKIGWSVKKINERTYEFTKKIDNGVPLLMDFINTVVSSQPII